MAVTFGIGVALLAAETTVPLWQVVLAAIPLSAGAWWLSGALQRQRARDAVRWERRWARWRAWWRQRRGR